MQGLSQPLQGKSSQLEALGAHATWGGRCMFRPELILKKLPTLLFFATLLVASTLVVDDVLHDLRTLGGRNSDSGQLRTLSQWSWVPKDSDDGMSQLAGGARFFSL